MPIQPQNASDRIEVNLDLVQRLEQIESDVYFDLYTAAPPDVTRKLGLQVYRNRGVVATLCSNSDVYALNRVGALGVFEEIDQVWLDALLGEFRESGHARIFVNEVPLGIDNETAVKLRRAGLRHYNNWVKLYRDCSPAPPVDCTLDIRPITSGHAIEFGRIFSDAAGWPDIAATWLAAVIDRPGWRTFGAFDGSQLVATAALYVGFRTGALTFASTRPEYRGRGAQAALISRRIEEAASLGCDLLSVETGQDRPGHSIPSHRNVQRCGFKEAYIRGNYVWPDDA